MKYNKKPLNEVDSMLRQEFNSMCAQPIEPFTIKYVYGFEKGGSYENWGNEWIIRGNGHDGKEIVVVHRRIDKAVSLWLNKYQNSKNES